MITFDMRDFERHAKHVYAAASQVPYALSLALNDSAFEARKTLIGTTWPGAIKVRNKGFIRAALRVDVASKHNLTVAVVDKLGRGHLNLHAHGGVKQSKGRLAIPTARVVRGASGVRASQKPRNLKRAVVKGNLIYQATGSKKNSRLQLMYKLRPSAKIKKDVPFVADFETVMRREMVQRFPKAIEKAMRSMR